LSGGMLSLPLPAASTHVSIVSQAQRRSESLNSYLRFAKSNKYKGNVLEVEF